MTGTDPAATALDISEWPTAQKFVAKCSEFLNEVQDLYARPNIHTPPTPNTKLVLPQVYSLQC